MKALRVWPETPDGGDSAKQENKLLTFGLFTDQKLLKLLLKFLSRGSVSIQLNYKQQEI